MIATINAQQANDVTCLTCHVIQAYTARQFAVSIERAILVFPSRKNTAYGTPFYQWKGVFDSETEQLMAKNQRRYTDEERASLVVMLQAEGYPDKLGALKKVAEYAGMHENVLRRWWKGTQNPPPTTSVSHKKIDLSSAINDELIAIFTEMKTKREEADYRALGTVAGILFDKKQLLEGKPTQINDFNVKSYQSFSPDDWDTDTSPPDA